jgi:CO/xanthine dehydrogenase Mo-binding subunit
MARLLLVTVMCPSHDVTRACIWGSARPSRRAAPAHRTGRSTRYEQGVAVDRRAAHEIESVLGVDRRGHVLKIPQRLTVRAGTNPSGDLSLRPPGRGTETTARPAENEAINHTGVIGRELPGDASSRGDARDIDGLAGR